MPFNYADQLLPERGHVELAGCCVVSVFGRNGLSEEVSQRQGDLCVKMCVGGRATVSKGSYAASGCPHKHQRNVCSLKMSIQRLPCNP